MIWNANFPYYMIIEKFRMCGELILTMPLRPWGHSCLLLRKHARHIVPLCAIKAHYEMPSRGHYLSPLLEICLQNSIQMQ
jgi:hypothetical protein